MSRMVIDYNKLNNMMRAEMYPIPHISQTIDTVSKCKYFTTFDLIKGYHQIGMLEEVKKVSAFTCEYGNYQFNHMPFGLISAGFTFQKLMSSILMPYSSFALAYIDDVIVFDDTIKEHLKHVDQVCKCLAKNNLMVKPSKVQLCKEKVMFLGHVIRGGENKYCQKNSYLYLSINALKINAK